MNPPSESDNSSSESDFNVRGPAAAAAAPPAVSGNPELALSDDEAWSNPDGGDDDDLNGGTGGGPAKPDVDALCPQAAFGGGVAKPRAKSAFVTTRGGGDSDSDSDGSPPAAAASQRPAPASAEDAIGGGGSAAPVPTMSTMAPPPEDDTDDSGDDDDDVDTFELPAPKPLVIGSGGHVDPMVISPNALSVPQRSRLTATPTGPLPSSVLARISPAVQNAPSSAGGRNASPPTTAAASQQRDSEGSSPPQGAHAAHASDAIDVDFDDLVIDDLPGGDEPTRFDGNADDAIDLTGAPVSGSRPDRELAQLQRPVPTRTPPQAALQPPAQVRTPPDTTGGSPSRTQTGLAFGAVSDTSSVSLSAPTSTSAPSTNRGGAPQQLPEPAASGAPPAGGGPQPSRAYLQAKQQALQLQQQQQQQQQEAGTGAGPSPAAPGAPTAGPKAPGPTSLPRVVRVVPPPAAGAAASPAAAAAPTPAAFSPSAAADADGGEAVERGAEEDWDRANDNFAALQEAAERDKKRPPLLNITWDEAIRELRVNQRDAWARFVTPDLKRISAKVATTGFLAACWSCWHHDIVEGSPLYEERDFVLALQKVEFDHSNETHRRVLLTIWRLLSQPRREDPDPPTTGPAWEALGFQGTNPATDLRATGLFGLLQLLFVVDYCPRFARALFDLGKSRVYQFPLAIVSFNFTATVLNCLLERLLHDQIVARFKEACADEASRAEMQRLSTRNGGTLFVSMVLNELLVGLLHKFYGMWQEEPTRRVMEFDQVRRPIVKFAHERTATALQGYAAAKSDFSREKLRDDRDKRLKKQLEPVLDKGPSRFTDF